MPFDQCNRSLQRLVDVERGGIEHMGIRGSFQRRRRATGVALIALADIRKDVGFGHLLAGRFEFQETPFGPYFRRGNDKYLHVGIRADHGADIIVKKLKLAGIT
jgi:hypothetical protein